MTEIAPAGRYLADVNHSSVLWRIKHMGLAWYTGRFTRFDAVLDFDPAAIEATRLVATVEVGSVRAEYQGTDKDWDRELADKPELLHALAHPQAVFTSQTVERTGDAAADVSGELAFRGFARPLRLAVTYNGALLKDPFGRTLIGFSATGTMTRSDWGLVFFLGPLMPEEVQLIIEAELVLQP